MKVIIFLPILLLSFAARQLLRRLVSLVLLLLSVLFQAVSKETRSLSKKIMKTLNSSSSEALTSNISQQRKFARDPACHLAGKR